MTTSNFDTNINSYTLAELLTILGLDYPDPNSITEKTNELIQKYKTNPSISTFFQNVQSQLLQYASDLADPNNNEDAEYPAGETQTKDWYKNEYLKQDKDEQVKKITDREQKIKLFGNEHVPMKREQLGVSNTYNVPIVQDKLNPKLENVTQRFINLDSQFRQSTNAGVSSSSDYTLDLSDYLPNVLSMKLYSFQIPFCWYVIDEVYGNTCFWITNDINTNINISIDPGNYSSSDFVKALNSSFATAGFTFPNTIPINTPVVYNSNTGKITLNLMNGIFSGNNEFASFTITSTTVITFFDYTTKLQCTNNNCVSTGFYINQTLGWIMGYRLPFINVSSSGNTAPALLDLNGTKYLILIIDDYNQNHINNGLVSISEYSNTLKIPSYYSPDIPYTCSQSTSNTSTLSNSYQNYSTNTDIGLVVADKLNPGYIKYPQVLPSAPRILTQPQIYTINEIIKNNDKTTNYRSKAPTNNDIFAILPIKTSGLSTGSLIVENAGTLQLNSRVYFGPVNIERLRVKLVDDKGITLNVNGADWTVTILCECLYQY
jgi:hypothetical protein